MYITHVMKVLSTGAIILRLHHVILCCKCHHFVSPCDQNQMVEFMRECYFTHVWTTME